MDLWLETKQFPVHMVSAAGLVYRESKVLLVRSERRGWEFPGGVIEQGETITEGLKREIREESGVLAQPLALAAVNQNLARKKGYGPLEGMLLPPMVIFDFICAYTGETEAETGESQEIGWFSPEKALELVRYPGYGKRLANMLRFREKITLCAFEKLSGEIQNYREITLNGGGTAQIGQE